ncbi:MAG: hypothetical protein ACLP8X_44120 [Streptosporangiaceae bacterium]
MTASVLMTAVDDLLVKVGGASSGRGGLVARLLGFGAQHDPVSGGTIQSSRDRARDIHGKILGLQIDLYEFKVRS